jgi:tRNA threonylcarbamoyladenosine biosynthesis protein TsaB
MLIVGIETATMTGGIALLSEERLISEYTLNVRTTHSARLMPALDQVLKDSHVDKREIDGIAVSIGPGSFTGLRIGLATAKGLALGLGVPLLGIPTLDALARNIPFAMYQICPMLDAKKKEVYYSLFRYEGSGVSRPEACPKRVDIEGDQGGTEKSVPQTSWQHVLLRQVPYQVVPPADLVEQIHEKTIFLGDAVDVYRELISEKLGNMALFAPDAQRLPRAAAVAEIGLLKLKAGEHLDIASAEPIYIRPSDAEISLAKKRRKKESRVARIDESHDSGSMGL